MTYIIGDEQFVCMSDFPIHGNPEMLSKKMFVDLQDLGLWLARYSVCKKCGDNLLTLQFFRCIIAALKALVFFSVSV